MSCQLRRNQNRATSCGECKLPTSCGLPICHSPLLSWSASKTSSAIKKKNNNKNLKNKIKKKKKKGGKKNTAPQNKQELKVSPCSCGLKKLLKLVHHLRNSTSAAFCCVALCYSKSEWLDAVINVFSIRYLDGLWEKWWYMPMTTSLCCPWFVVRFPVWQRYPCRQHSILLLHCRLTLYPFQMSTS